MFSIIRHFACILLLVGILFTMHSCDSSKRNLSAADGFEETLLLNCWKHSYEDNVKESEDIFMTCSSKNTMAT